MTQQNADTKTVAGFGDQWTRFDWGGVEESEVKKAFDLYFRIFPWSELPRDACGFDLGCGSGRYTKLVAPRVGTLHCIDASEAALEVAKRNLRYLGNCVFHHASVESLPLEDESMDFGYSLGVLHHVPDTAGGIAACVRKLKMGAPFLVYLYYALETRPAWFRAIWRATDVVRRGVSSMPYPLRYAASQALAVSVYLPLARSARALEKAGFDVSNFPLAAYRNQSFYSMRTDALDRFGTRLEQRFTRDQIRSMMETAGLERITFSEGGPFWCAVGYRAR